MDTETTSGLRALRDALAHAALRDGLLSSRAVLAVDQGGHLLFANVPGLRLVRAETLRDAFRRPLPARAGLRAALRAARALRPAQGARSGAFDVARARPPRSGGRGLLVLSARAPGPGLLRQTPTLADLEARLGLGPVRIAPPSTLPGGVDVADLGEGLAVRTAQGVLVIGHGLDARHAERMDRAAETVGWRLDEEDRVLRGPEHVLHRSLRALVPEPEVEAALTARRAFSGIAAAWPMADGTRRPARLSGRPIFRPDGRYRGLRGQAALQVAASGGSAVDPAGFEVGTSTQEHADDAPRAVKRNDVPGHAALSDPPGGRFPPTAMDGPAVGTTDRRPPVRVVPSAVTTGDDPIDAPSEPAAIEDRGTCDIEATDPPSGNLGEGTAAPLPTTTDEPSTPDTLPLDQAGDAATPPHGEGGADASAILSSPRPPALDPLVVTRSAPDASTEDAPAGGDIAEPIEASNAEASSLSHGERDAFAQIAALLQGGEFAHAGAEDAVEDGARDAITTSWSAAEAGRIAIRDELDAVPMALVVYRDADVLFLNRAAGRMLAYGSAEELALHGGVEALFPPEDEGTPPARPVPTRRVLRSDGTTLDLVTSLRTIRWQGATAFLLTLRRPDVSGGDNGAPATLPADALLDALPLGILSLGGDGRVHSANSGAADLLRVPADDLIGAPLTHLVCEPHRRAVLDDLHALMRGEARPPRTVNGLGAPGGDRDVPEIDLTLRRIRRGEGYHVLALVQDASSRRADARARQAAEAELARLRGERGAFLKRVSHELRTPLNAIVGFAEVMREERFGPLGSVRYQDYARSIEDSGRQLIGMVGDLLDLVRLQEREGDLGNASHGTGLDEVGLNEVVSRCVSDIYARAGERRIIIRCSLAQALPRVRADAESLTQIVANLLENGVRLTEPGGQVIVSTRPAEDGSVTVRVRDGSTLDARALSAAVSPFGLELDTAPPPEPVGLGLPLTRALAQANGAGFTIDSAAGRGTVTQIVFPPERVVAA